METPLGCAHILADDNSEGKGSLSLPLIERVSSVGISVGSMPDLKEVL